MKILVVDDEAGYTAIIRTAFSEGNKIWRV